MTVEVYSRDVDEFDNLLRRIGNEITGGAIPEGLIPAELWKRSESMVASLQNLANRIMKIMLLLKPEKAPIIEKQHEAISGPLNAFKEALFRKTEDPTGSVRLALGHLRKSVAEGSEFLRLAKDVESHPSEVISEILKLKEVYAAKDYLSALPVPETVHARFLGLKKRLENLRSHIFNLEKGLEDIKTQMDAVEEEIEKFRPLPIRTEERKEGQEREKPT